jgi:hypothetical protein
MSNIATEMKILDLANKVKRLVTHSGKARHYLRSHHQCIDLFTLTCLYDCRIHHFNQHYDNNFDIAISVELDLIMKAISISKDKYEAEEERLTKLSDAVDTKTKTVSNTVNCEGNKMSKAKQSYRQTSDGDKSLLIPTVSAVIQRNINDDPKARVLICEADKLIIEQQS